MPSTSVILFDFDGTICDDFKEAILILNKLSDEFGYRKVDANQLEEFREMGTRGILKNLHIPAYKLPFILTRARRELQEKIKEFRPIAGMPEVLSQLSAQKIILGIVTSNTEENVRTFLDRNKLDYFRWFSTGSSIFGKSRLIKKLLKAEGIAPASTLYVGDETRDVEAARASKVKSAAVSWGFNSKEALALENPDFLIHEPKDLLDIVG